MLDPYLGEIRLFPYTFAPMYWALCNGQTLNIAQNTALYAVIGTAFGGNGRTTFGLPNLQGRVMVGPGQGPGLSPYLTGQTGGTATVPLTLANLPAHNHTLNAVGMHGESTVSAANQLAIAAAGTLQRPVNGKAYAAGSTSTSLSPVVLSQTGGSSAHNNMQPYVVLNYCIALTGVFPVRS